MNTGLRCLCGGKELAHLFHAAAMYMLCVLLGAAFLLGSAHRAEAAFTDCPALPYSGVSSDSLIVDLTDDSCFLNNAGPYPPGALPSDDYVHIKQAVPAQGSGHYFEITPGANTISFQVNGGAVISNFGDAGSAVIHDCTAGCLITGSSNGTPFSFTFTSAPGGTGAVAPPDTTAPTVTSVLRQTPSSAATSSDTLVFRVTFSEDVQNVDAADFDASGTSGDASAVNGVSASVYDVTVSGGDLATYNGTVGLTFAGAQNIQDLAGNALTNTTPGTGQTYTVANVPEISVAETGLSQGAIADEGTLAQGTKAAGTAYTLTFTVVNSGTGDLTLATATSSGPTNVTVNSVGAPGSTTVTAGGTTTFAVQYTPTLAGAFSFGLSFVNNDADENPYNFTVSGTATGAPEISVSSSEGGVLTDGGADAQGNEPLGVSKVVTYTITNTGTDALMLTGAPYISGGPTNFSAGPTVSVAGILLSIPPAGGSTTFTVTYTPAAAGTFDYDLIVRTNDADEADFNINATGTATGTPELDVRNSGDTATIGDGSTTHTFALGTDLGTVLVGSNTTSSFRAENNGTGVLTFGADALAISNTTDFTITGDLTNSGTVAAGGQAPFTIRFNPASPGVKTATITLRSDDANEDPYVFTISGTGVAPEIEVSETGQGLGAIADSGTLAVGTRAAGTAHTLIFTVTNSGSGSLTLATPTSSGATNITVNDIDGPLSTNVGGGGSMTTFSVQYTPTIAGAFSFDVSFVNSDADENPYNFTISGTATGTPEIEVAETGQGQGAIPAHATLNQGSKVAGTAQTLTFTVTNTGTDNLTLATATSQTPSNVTVNSVGAPGTTTVAPAGGTTTFAVQYTPTIAGAFSFDLSFVNNDGDENPYRFTVGGTVSNAPDVAVTETGQGQGAVADSGTLAQGTKAAGTAQTLTFTVANSGTGNLTLATATSSSLSNVTVNSIGAPGTTTVAPAGTTTFTVQYTPTIAGAFSFDLSFVNNDADEDPYNFTVSGTATGAPEISVSSSEGGVLTDGGADAQGNEPAGVSKVVTYTITNTGTDALLLTGAPYIPGGPTNFSAGPTVSTAGILLSIPPAGGSTTFTVTYTPAVAGAFDYDLVVRTNDADEADFNIDVSGTATGTPEIEVSSSESGALSDAGTDAHGNETAGTAKNVTYTVTNTGLADLTIATATSSSLNNVTVNSIGVPSSTTVAPAGGTATFVVNYTPTNDGAYSFDLSFVTDDADENPFNFTVSGTALGDPEIEVSSSESGAVSDGGTDAQGSELVGVMKTVTYTVTNSGTAELSLGAAISSGLSNVTINSLSIPGSLTLAPGGASTTFTVQYTPTAAGAFSFDLRFNNNDVGEGPYNITVSGTAFSAPEIEVSSSVTGAIANTGQDVIGNAVAGVPTSVTYTITNTGSAPLTLGGTPTVATALNVAGTPTSTAPGSLSLAPGGGSTTFTVTFTPAAAGFSIVNVSFPNNDADEAPFTLQIIATGVAAPKIAVSSSESGAVADGGTDAQGAEASLVAKVVTYTITNIGSDTLSLAGTPTVSGATNLVGAPVVSAPGSVSLAPAGGSTTFTVTYTPNNIGAFGFDIDINSNDTSAPIYDIAVSGTATGAPELDLRNGLDNADIADGSAVISTALGTDYGSVEIGSSSSNSFIVKNTGNAALTFGADALSLSNTTDFSITTDLTNNGTVAANGSASFVIQFVPFSDGVRTAVVTLRSNDPDEDPYTFTIQGTATSAPTITSVARQTPASANTSDDTLIFRVTFNEDVQNVDAADFNASGTTADATAVTPVSASVYDVTVSGGNLAELNGTVGLTFDGAQNIQDLAGTALTNTTPGSNEEYVVANAPEIEVSSSEGGAVADLGTDAQGAEPAGTAKVVTYTVTNTGTATLILTGTPTVSAPFNVNATPVVSAPGSLSLAPGGGTTTFTVTYTPTIAGTFGFDVHILSNDANEASYDILVRGTASGAPEIALSSSESGALADAGTDPQGSEVAGTAKSVTYTVTNTGTDNLTLATATSSGLSNVTVNSIGAPGTTTVAPAGGTTTFVVNYTPTIAGAYSFDLSFVNNDADENPFNFTVSGNATGTPEIEVSSSEGGALADGGTDAQGTEVAGTGKSVVYTVTNIGTGDLALATATSSNPSNVTVNLVGGPGSTTVAAAGGTTTFTVLYTPTNAGAYSFDLSFVTDDADENPFNVTVSGTATGTPEIALSSSEGGAVTDAGTDAQGNETAGTAKTVTYTVTNTGTDTLTIATAGSSGASNVTVNSVGAPGSTTIAPAGGTTTFAVQYTPTSAGAFSFDLSFVTDDADENPFNFTVSGTSIAVPANLAVHDGGSQSTTIGTAFGTGLSVLVTDIHGNPVPGATVTYAVPGAGATAVLSASSAVTNAAGIATVTATAGTTAGAYAVTASVTGVTTPATFNLTNGVGAPASITVSAGGGQSTTVTTTFATDLSALVTDSGGNPIAGRLVIFSAPSTGASASITPGFTQTNAQGIATVSVSANGTAGSYVVTASTAGVTPNASFSLTNLVGAPAALVALSGGGQGTPPSTAFATPLVALVRDASSNPVPGVTVNFAVPASGASATLSAASAVSDANGEVSVTATANAVAGTYQVTVSSAGLGNSQFTLTNTDIVAPTVTLTTTATTVASGDSFTVSATFSEDVTGLTAGDVTVANGTATSVTGSGTSYTITVTASGAGQVSVSLPAGSAQDAAGNGNTASNVLTVADETVEQTSEIINDFIQTRAGQLVNNQPDLIGFLNGGRNGAFNLQATRNRTAFDLSFDASQSVWAQIIGSQTRQTSSTSTYVLAAFGSHIEVNPNLLIGAMLELDYFEQENGLATTTGSGWLVGPYVVGKVPDQDLYYEARLLYGQSTNDTSPFGTYTDSFETERLLAMAKVSGSLSYDRFDLNPYLTLSYTSDQQQSYVDNLGNVIPQQTYAMGQLAVGADFVAPLPTTTIPGDLFLTGGLEAINSYSDTTGPLATTGNAPDGLRGKLELGLIYEFSDTGNVFAEVTLDGIGRGDYESYSLEFGFDLEF